MFHLPREIIQLIFEFDGTYKEEYKKVLQVLNKFPVYCEIVNIYFDTYTPIYRYRYNFSSTTSLYPPNQYYFKFLRHKKFVAEYKCRQNYIHVISEIKYRNKVKKLN